MCAPRAPLSAARLPGTSDGGAAEPKYQRGQCPGEVLAFVWLVRLTQLTFGCICNPFRPRLFLAGTTWYFPDFSTPAAGAGGAGSAAARDAFAVSSPVHTAVLAAACR
jgi:hypothetical protein